MRRFSLFYCSASVLAELHAVRAELADMSKVLHVRNAQTTLLTMICNFEEVSDCFVYC